MVTLRAPGVLALLAVPGLFTPFPGLWLAAAAGLVVLLVGVDLAVAGAVGDLHCARAGDRQVRTGGTGTVRLTLTNHGARPVHGRVRDAWVPSAGATSTPSGSEHLTIDPGQSWEVVTELAPTRRGDRPAVRVTVRSYGPLGLAYRQTTRRQSARLTPPWTLRALPPFTSRRFLPEKLSRLRIIDGQVVARGRGQGTEFDSLREYVVGDDVRSIDWRATARAEHVMVKNWRPERDRRVLCVLDTGRTSAARVGDQPRLDAAIDAALLLAAVAAHAGDRVDLLAVDTQVRASVSTGLHRTLLPSLVDAMATLEPELSETDFGRVVSEVLYLARRQALVVLFTTLEPGALGEGLMPVLPQLLSRHRVLVASVQDPTLDALAAGRGTLSAVYTAAAAEKALAGRDRVRTALTRYGVQVVESLPASFASAVTDRYLDLKAAGAL
ncbi:MAG: DUF58 domain-containing protein [Micromonosporaceae bacterium]|nr:DUF58 domain-containing protein [Micromonosporaceae bacterium]